jgi:hypothetical protein
MKTKIPQEIEELKNVNEWVKECDVDDGNVSVLKRVYPIIVSDDEVIGTVGEEKIGIIKTSIAVTEKYGSGKSSYGYGIDNVIRNLDGEIEIAFEDQGPMLIISNNDKYESKFIIAPLIEDE